MAERYYREPADQIAAAMPRRPTLASLAPMDMAPVPEDPTGGDVFGTLFRGDTRRAPGDVRVGAGLESINLPDEAAVAGLGAAAQKANPSIRSMMTIPEGIDWAAEREGFLAQGNADREAMEASDAAMGARSIFPGGRTETDRQRDSLAFEGLQQARNQLNPAYGRRQKALGALEGAETFMDPTMTKARGMMQDEEVGQQGRLKELGLSLGVDPRALRLGALDFERKKELTGIDAAGRAGTYQMGGGGAGGAGKPPVSRAQVIQFAKDNNITVDEAVAIVEGEGRTIAQ